MVALSDNDQQLLADLTKHPGWAVLKGTVESSAEKRALGLSKVLLFTQEISTLLNAGVPLDRALTITAIIAASGGVVSWFTIRRGEPARPAHPGGLRRLLGPEPEAAPQLVPAGDPVTTAQVQLTPVMVAGILSTR